MQPASNADIEELVFDRFKVLFAMPAAETADALAKEYARVLRRFSREILRMAVDGLADSNKYRRWPTVAEVLTACRAASPKTSAVPAAPNCADTEQMVADALRSPDGQTALRAGYGLSVSVFVQDNNRLPSGAECEQMARDSEIAKTTAEKLANDKGSSRALKEIWKGMGRREQQLREKYLETTEEWRKS